VLAQPQPVPVGRRHRPGGAGRLSLDVAVPPGVVDVALQGGDDAKSGQSKSRTETQAIVYAAGPANTDKPMSMALLPFPGCATLMITRISPKKSSYTARMGLASIETTATAMTRMRTRRETR